MRYNQQLNYQKRRRFIRRIMIVVSLLLLALIAAGAYVLYDNYNANASNTEEQTTSNVTSSYVAPNIQVFRTPYFQFQTNKSWSEDPNASNKDKFVYRSLRDGLLEQMLTIYVNAPPTEDRVTRVLVAATNGERGLRSVKISEHCGKSGNYTNSSKTVKLDEVTFSCFGDDTRYTTTVGIAGGTPNISLPRPDGSLATYSIYYSNVTANPESTPLQEIVNSFQTR